MPSQNRTEGSLHVAGQLSCQTFTPPAGSVVNASIAAGSAGSYIERSKGVQGHAITNELFGPTTAVTAVTRWWHTVRGATGTVVSVEAAIAVVATGADRTITVDLHKSTGAGAFATILSATAGFTNASAVRTPVAGTISTASLVDGDILAIVVTVAGAAGNQATGLTVTVNIGEDPQ